MMKYFLIALLAALLSSCAPNNYEDCVLDNIKDAADRYVVGAIKQACRAKFPAKPVKREEWPDVTCSELLQDCSKFEDSDNT